MRKLESSEMAYSENIAKAVKKHFDKNDWKYSFDKTNGLFRANMRIGGKISSIVLSIYIQEDAFTAYFSIPVFADENNCQKVAEFITRANFGLRNGNFEMDFSDGEVRFKIHVPVMLKKIPDSLIGFTIYMGVTMIRHYADELLTVMFGFMTPAEAMEKIEKKMLLADDDSDSDYEDDDLLFPDINKDSFDEDTPFNEENDSSNENNDSDDDNDDGLDDLFGGNFNNPQGK